SLFPRRRAAARAAPHPSEARLDGQHPAPSAPPAQPGGGFRYVPEPPAGGGGRFLLDALRRRRGGRVLLSTLTVTLFVAGAGLFAYPLLTDLYADRVVQQQLAGEFERLEAADWQPAASAGSPLTRILIPDLDVDTIVVAGTTPAALRAGAGHYPDTPLPGAVGNVGIAGHRTTYGRPFNRIDELAVGDEIWLLTPAGDHRYVVTAPPDDGDCQPLADGAGCLTHPYDWSVVAPSDQALLTLTTCHPKGSAAQRLVVRAELADSHPAGTRAPATPEQDDAPAGV
ncbi:sortase, partial [Egicoccus sp. AB-alg2]|uniref:sortase n=1 Tax=Egicoccus sp. AB-alg2 TaxID=3242693 RepID=UPI00359EFC26